MSLSVKSGGGSATLPTNLTDIPSVGFDAGTSTIGGQTMHAGAAAQIALISEGDVYEFQATFTKGATGQSPAVVLTNAKNAAHYLIWLINTNGNLSLENDAGPINASGTGKLANTATNVSIFGRVTFGAAGNMMECGGFGVPAGMDTTINFVGGPLWVANPAFSGTPAPVKIVFRKLNP